MRSAQFCVLRAENLSIMVAGHGDNETRRQGDAKTTPPRTSPCLPLSLSPCLSLRTLTCALIFLTFLTFLTGCGYHISGSAETEPGYQWHSLYRDDVKTVAVPIFTNRTFYQHIEDELTTAIVKQLEAFTPYKVAPRERADTILEGDILRVRLRTISRNPFAAVPQEQMYIIVVNFRWRDLRTGKILVERRDYEQTSSFYPTLGEDQWVGEQDAAERLARAIVGELQADWGRDKPTTSPTSGPIAPEADTTNQASP